MPNMQQSHPAEEGRDGRRTVEAHTPRGYKQDKPNASSANAEENHLQGVTTMDTNKCREALEEWFEPSGKGLERDGGESYKCMFAIFLPAEESQATLEQADETN